MLDTASEMAAVASSMETPASASPADTTPTPTTPTPATPDSSTPAAPAIQGTSTQPLPVADPEPTGPIPLDRHKAILDKARADHQAQLQSLEWAKTINREEYERDTRVVAAMREDPVTFYRFLEARLKSDPQLAAHLGANTAPPAPEPEPKPDVLLEDGTLVYSNAQMAKLLSHRERNLMAQIEQRFGPVVQETQERKMQEAAYNGARAQFSEARTWPGFEESMPDIAKLMEGDKRVTLESAYRRVVVPKMQAQEKELRDKVRQEVLTELNTKGQSVTVKPGAPAAPAPASFKGMSTEDIMRNVAQELAGSR